MDNSHYAGPATAIDSNIVASPVRKKLWNRPSSAINASNVPAAQISATYESECSAQEFEHITLTEEEHLKQLADFYENVVFSDEEIELMEAAHTASIYGERTEFNANIQVTCSNDCVYCGSAVKAVERGFVRDRARWANDFLLKQVPAFNKKYDCVVRYPTNHDVTLKYLDRHCKAIQEILEAGNDLVINTKPRLRCMEAVAKVCADHKVNVIFNLSITSLDETQSIFWEKNAPLPTERIAAMKFLSERGFRIGVSVEPLLQGSGSAMEIYNAVFPYVTESICFGTMSMVAERVDTTSPGYIEALTNIKRYQSEDNLRFLYNSMKNLPKVTFKNTISKFGR